MLDAVLMERGSTLFRFASLATRTIARAERVLSMGANALRESTHGVLAGALHPHERAALGVQLYEARLGTTRDRLVDWEERWFAEDLPTPPASILVGGAGDGREALPLTARGYVVGAFDPGRRAIDRCRLALGERAVVGTYEELAAAVLDGASIEKWRTIVSTRWDAVILGWTSIMHVLSEEDRARLIATVDRLCPDGPVLLTFHASVARRTPGRVHDGASRLGSAVGRARGVCAAGPEESFGLGCGFLRGAMPEEIGRAASRVGRRAVERGTEGGCIRMTLPPRERL